MPLEIQEDPYYNGGKVVDGSSIDENMEDIAEVNPEQDAFLQQQQQQRQQHQIMKKDDSKDDCNTTSYACLVVKLLSVFLIMTIGISSTVWVVDNNHKATTTSPPVLRFRRIHQSPSSQIWSTFTGSSKSSSTGSNSNSNNGNNGCWHWATFRIMQITDMHLGEDEYTDWGPKQDYETFHLLDRMFRYEQPPPDLIVLSGDQLTANNCLHNCTEYYTLLGKYLTLHGIPWAMVLGNHDDMAFESYNDHNHDTIPHSYTRRELLSVDESFPLSLTQTGPTDVVGASNYVLNVLEPDTLQPAVQLFFLDSGGGTLPEAVDASQVEWLKTQISQRPDLPAVAFQHIPTVEHIYRDASCIGFQGEEMTPLMDNAGLIDTMVESKRFHFLAVGHFHGNDYCCPYYYHDQNKSDDDVVDDALYFCFGRHSGYGGYGNWQRGVRMYELQIRVSDGDVSSSTEFSHQDDLRQVFRWRSWVRLESGAYVDFLDFDHAPGSGKR